MKTRGRLLAATAVTILVTTAFAGPVVAQSAPSAAQNASLKTYLPEVQRLKQKADWAALEQLARQAMTDLAQLGPETIDVALATDWLGVALFQQGRNAEAEPLFRRALAITEKALGEEDPLTTSNLINVAEVLRVQARYAEAEPLARRALASNEKAGRELGVAGSLNGLAILLEAQGRFKEAEPLIRRALAIYEKALGPEHPKTAISLAYLSGWLLDQGRYAQAEPLVRRALAINEKALGEEDPQTTNNLIELADLLRLQGRYDEAEPLLRRALASNEKAGREQGVARGLNNLAVLLGLQGRYAEAEPLYRRALASNEKVLGKEDPLTGVNLIDLADLLEAQGRYAEAEPLLRSALASSEKAGREQGVAGSLNSLAMLLRMEGRYEEAEPVSRRAQAIIEKVFGPEHPKTAISLNNLGGSLMEQGRFGEAESLNRRALAIDEKVLGPEHPETAIQLSNLAVLLQDQGRYDEADPLYRRALATSEKALGPEHTNVATQLINLAGSLMEQGRYAEAEPLCRRALSIDEKALGPEHPSAAVIIDRLARLLQVQGRYAEAEPLSRRALAINEKALGPEHPHTASSLNDLATVLRDQRRYAEAEPIVRRALAIDEKALGAEHPGTAASLNNLALVLQSQSRYAEADPHFRRALAIEEKALGPEHPDTASAREDLGRNDEYQGKFSDASGNYRLACPTRSSAGRARDLSGDAALIAQEKANTCSTQLSLSLWGWSAQGGGTAASDHPDALKREAFSASQRAVTSAAGDALARSAAMRVARSAAVGPQARDYEAALLERDTLDQQFATAASDIGQEAVGKRQALAKAHDEVVARVERLSAELKTRAPRYWDYRSPEAVSVSALQAKTGADATLLHDDEALIAFLVAPGKDKGLVFAVSKQQIAWAQLGLTGDELKARVIKLRAQIDPEGYRLPGTVAGHNTSTDGASNPGAFDRQAAYQLYQLLLGDASIQALIKEKPVLLFVPSGPLTSLPPGLLVTAPPAGGAAGDADPAALRATPWLLRSKAVALLPAVSSLRTLRQILPAARISTPDPLLVFADPDFSRLGTAPKTRVASAPERGFSTYFRDGVPLAEALDNVPSLPGTRIEGEALERALHGRPGSLLTGRNASKAQLMARNADGRLAQVRVLEFATHGLVAGDASDLAEPALVLAADATPADELLLASEAATLKLNADWVLLSACNTASPDAPEAQGLSGLSRAFFYAGAKSLLVSHWRVRDDVAPLLIPAMLLAERQHPELGHAQALRQASLAILDNRSLNATDPAAWAPFTLIGEAEP